ncbi:MAG: hypothetical protein U0R27_02165 [Candidatus Nanopelagicales bacterium]
MTRSTGARGPRAAGLVTVDFIVNDEGVHFLEANVAPGMTETSLFPQAAAGSPRAWSPQR